MSPDPPTSLHSKLTNIQNQACCKETIACDAHFATALLSEKKDDAHKANALSPLLPSHSVIQAQYKKPPQYRGRVLWQLTTQMDIFQLQ
jgi:hypothetical protein